MIVAMVIVSFFRAGGIFIIVMLSMTVTTIIFSITTYVKNVKQYKKDTKERDQRYREYLKDKTAELHRAIEEQRHALEYHYPDVKRLRDMAVNVDARIYEKTMYHHDFLHYRVGLVQVKTSFEILFSDEEFLQERDEFFDAARALRTHYANVDNVPVVTSLVNGPIDYIG